MSSFGEFEEMRVSDNPKKLQPFEFFEKIGSPKLVVAPMVDHSELSYRMLTR
jgi:tRNA-dihydrouridine synthase 1